MSSRSNPTPDSILVLYRDDGVDVFFLALTLTGKVRILNQTAPQQSIGLSSNALAPIFQPWPLRQGTPVVLIPPPNVGGFHCVPIPKGDRPTSAWAISRLSPRLPYEPTELAWDHEIASGFAEISWLPRAWIEEQQRRFADFGLTLDRIIPRWTLFRPAPATPDLQQQTRYVQEKHQESLYLYEFFGTRHVRQLAVNPGSVIVEAAGNPGQRAELENELPAGIASFPAHISHSVLELAVASGAGIKPQQTLRKLWAPFIRLAAVTVFAALLVAVALDWDNGQLRDKQAAMRAEGKRLEPFHTRNQAALAETASFRSYLLAVRDLDGSENPLALLTLVARHLPAGAWLHSATTDQSKLTISGVGATSQKVATELALIDGLTVGPVPPALPVGKDFELVLWRNDNDSPETRPASDAAKP